MSLESDWSRDNKGTEGAAAGTDEIIITGGGKIGEGNTVVGDADLSQGNTVVGDADSSEGNTAAGSAIVETRGSATGQADSDINTGRLNGGLEILGGGSTAAGGSDTVSGGGITPETAAGGVIKTPGDISAGRGIINVETGGPSAGEGESSAEGK